MPRRATAPVWLMGLSNAVFGMFSGILVITVPQLLSARHVPEARIAEMTAVMISPGFWTFLLSPVLDVRFSRRDYSIATAVLAALCLAAALLLLDDPAKVEALLLAGFFFANLFQSALGGWLSSITAAPDENRLSVWVTIGNIAGGGLIAIAAGEIASRLPPALTALVLGGMTLLPMAVFAWMPAPGPDRRLARESFGRFFGDLVGLVRQPNVLIALALFVAPAATFSLTNFLSGVGEDFHASPRVVGLVGGAGVMAGGIVGCLAFQGIDRLMPTRLLYLAIGVAGSLFTLALILLPLTPTTFAVALIGENVWQALAITASTAITFETIGRNNPLAATVFCLMTSAFNVPITYMVLVDGAGYAWRGVAGSLAADAGLSLLACVLLGGLLMRAARRRAAIDPPDALPGT